MMHRMHLSLCVLLVGTTTRAQEAPAPPQVEPIVRVLTVSDVEKDRQRILFIQTVELRTVVVQDGKKVVKSRPVTAVAAFDLKRGKVLTAAGKALKADEVFRRLKPGDAVAVMRDMGEPLEGEEDPALRFRRMFRGDVLILVGELQALERP
jgi:hypothetical protein